MLSASNDVLFEILDWLDIRAFVAVSRATRGATTRCQSWIAARGLLETADCSHEHFYAKLRAEFVCSCGRVGWNIQCNCTCWIECYICTRRLPRALLNFPERRKCGYGCVCWFCSECCARVDMSDCIRNGRILLRRGDRSVCESCFQNGINAPYRFIEARYIKDYFAWWAILWRNIKCEGVEFPIPDFYKETEDERFRWALLPILRLRDRNNPLIGLLES